jgi:fumarylacetoacetase
LSGPAAQQAGSLLELTRGGQQALQLSNGEMRTYLHDGDSIVLRGRCESAGFRAIGFDECRGTVQPPVAFASRPAASDVD